MRLSVLSIVSLALAASASSPKSYDGWKVIHINTERGRESVLDQLSSISFDEWNTSEEEITIAVSPSQLAELEVLQLPYTVMHEDLGASITAESAQVAGKWKRQVDDLSWFDSYHSYEEHRAYFDELHAKFPNNSEIVSSGTSYEGRDIWGLHFWGANGPGQPAVLWHGTVHAREWIAAPVIEYITRQLILGYGGEDETITNFVNSYDFYVFPFVNPDGFVYTQTTERLWRKSRQPGPGNTTCYGRDINRNWPHGWDANPSGASTDPCSLFYKGEAPGDTPEMQGLSAFVDGLRDTNGIKLFIDWHSYSQYILSPLGHNCTTYIPNLGEHLQIAHRAARAIRGVEGVQFTYGPSCPLLYSSTGYSVDYAYEVGKADYAYLIELRDTGNYGFVLPPGQILPSVREQWAGIQVILGLLDKVLF